MDKEDTFKFWDVGYLEMVVRVVKLYNIWFSNYKTDMAMGLLCMAILESVILSLTFFMNKK